jgi:hypothetical protein
MEGRRGRGRERNRSGGKEDAEPMARCAAGLEVVRGCPRVQVVAGEIEMGTL